MLAILANIKYTQVLDRYIYFEMFILYPKLKQIQVELTPTFLDESRKVALHLIQRKYKVRYFLSVIETTYLFDSLYLLDFPITLECRFRSVDKLKTHYVAPHWIYQQVCALKQRFIFIQSCKLFWTGSVYFIVYTSDMKHDHFTYIMSRTCLNLTIKIYEIINEDFT